MNEAIRSAAGYNDRIPCWREPGEGAPIFIVNGGQGFVRKPGPATLQRDARRIGRLLPRGRGFILLGYDPDPPEGLTVDAIVESVTAAIEDASRPPVPIIGISYGGVIAARVAASRPELVDRLILLASAPRFSAEGLARIRRQIALASAGDTGAFLEEFGAMFRRRWMNVLLRLRLRFARRRLEQRLATADTIVRYLKAMLAAAEIKPESISAPTLIIGGTEDQFFGQGTMKDAADRTPLGDLILLNGETHMAPVERARLVAGAIATFLGGQSQRASL